ncbi:MAG: DUF4185 domain-containing protein, partial [Candidatus Fervidibacter sp.]|uniref:DUF4185 domain-containing protein n=1 Tax=Candidatus Fervidibacter sp. TaxID=3100871 RepID=UPI004048F317
AVLKVNEWVFVYGVREDKKQRPLKRSLVVARVPSGRLEDFGAWRFHERGEWTTNWQNAECFGDDLGFEFTISFVPSLNRFTLLYSPADLSSVVRIRLSSTPFGKWSEPTTVYECPEPELYPSVFCYAAKAHPHLSAQGELLVTYASNSFEFHTLVENAELYFPHFVKLRFEKP